MVLEPDFRYPTTSLNYTLLKSYLSIKVYMYIPITVTVSPIAIVQKKVTNLRPSNEKYDVESGSIT